MMNIQAPVRQKQHYTLTNINFFHFSLKGGLPRFGYGPTHRTESESNWDPDPDPQYS
jgi:hypothetical protein